MTRLVLAMLFASTVACGATLQRRATDIEYLRGIVHLLDCGDRRPARVLIDPTCRDGICGITCAPGRWTPRFPEP
jgi:hypothetical protein